MTVPHSTMQKVRLPFTGFYQTYAGLQQEDMASSAASWHLFDMPYDDLDHEQMYSVDNFIENTGLYRKAAFLLAQQYTDAFIKEYDLIGGFEDLVQPREYNFNTDAIIASVSYGKLLEALGKVDKTHLTDFIKVQLEPRDGFIPFYSNDYAEWGEPSTWDMPQWELVLHALVAQDYDARPLTQLYMSFELDTDSLEVI